MKNDVNIPFQYEELQLLVIEIGSDITLGSY